MRGFRAVGGLYVAGLGPTEREVFAGVVADVAQLLGAEQLGAPAGAGPEAPTDAVTDPGGGDPTSALGPRMSTADLPAPVDPAVRRLLPDASRDDDGVAAEFRRLTEADLRAAKIGRLRDLWQALSGGGDHVPGLGLDDDLDLAVTRDDAPAFAAALTDVRLVLADRLGLESEEDADRLYTSLEEQAAAEEAGWVPDDDRPAREVVAAEIRAYLGSVYAALTWLQESLMALLLADLGRDPGTGPGTGRDTGPGMRPDAGPE
ncbi:DUF2017 domain-containing protein [uncultured Cellulomonas sp.]|uniref:DUF2017 domain-containing protein n=1 Tax=uncultured Cellulomonas sp. TaxID=189682 RepID=UPI0026230D5A|nr:DUF2017 domain-containing protein [uncultured Cellulomonas sp.]